jgi:hypothetical protein
VQSRLNVGVSHNRARNQLREQHDISREGEDVFLDSCVPAIQVDIVAQKLESVETNPDWHNQPGQRNLKPGDSVDVAQKKVGVFEVEQS